MFDLLLHADRFWVKTFWPITVASLGVWSASKVIAHPNGGRWLWRACLLKLLAVSLVPISLAIPFLPAETTPSSQQREVLPRHAFPGEISAREPARGTVDQKWTTVSLGARFPAVTTRRLCEGVWYFGLGLGLICIVAQWLSVRRRLLRLPLLSDECLTAAAGEIAQAIGLHRIPPIARDSEGGSPRLVGLLRPTLIFPAWLLDEAEDQDVRLILAHEFAHAKCRDLF